MRLTLQQVSVALDVIYHNAVKADQKPKTKLYKDAGLSINTFNKLINSLMQRQLLFISGNTRNQKISWNKEKCAMNPKLVQSIYQELYVHEAPKRRRTAKPIKMQYDEIVTYLRSRGWRGTLERVKETDGIIRNVQYLDI